MAGGDPPPLDPFCTPIHADALPTEVESACKALEEARVREQQEREIFCLEKKITTEISEHQQ
jgi:hypothetical protein